MKNTNNLQRMLAIAAVAILAACGGGGGGSSTTPSNTPVNTTPTPAPTASVTNPLTGAAAPGSPTKTLFGLTAPGATVTAYAVKADGSSGPALGAPVVAGATSGEFTINMSEAPTGMVRLVSVGGSTFRTADSTKQPIGTQQLVTPFVTTAYNNFKISPLTDIAANVFATRASKGDTLAAAFGAGSRAVLQLDTANLLFLQDTTVWLNLLKGSIVSDTTYYAQQSSDAHELLTAVDYLGILLDLPSMDTSRVLSASAQGGYAQSGVDGSGAPIIAGAWVSSGKFDSTSPVTFKALMDAKVPDAQKVTDSTGAKVAPKLSDYIGKYLVLDFALDRACYNNDPQYLTIRYPFYQLDSQGKVPAADCTAAMQRVSDLRARVATNNSTSMK